MMLKIAMIEPNSEPNPVLVDSLHAGRPCDWRRDDNAALGGTVLLEMNGTARHSAW